jgi:C4-dicarboxylate transporter
MLLQGIGILIVFFVFAVLMVTRRMHTILALICMAILIALIGGVPFTGETGLLADVLDAGAMRMASAIGALIFGAWLGQVMTQTGISQDIIRRAAELGGDRPLAVALALAVAVALLFTTLGGTGAVIMVGSIVMPILMSVGFSAVQAAAMYLIPFAVGIVVNLANLQTYASIASVDLDIIKQFAIIQLVISAVVALAYIVWEGRKPKAAWAAVDKEEMEKQLSDIKKVPIYALLTPILPLVLVLIFDWPVIPAFMVGIIYGVLTTDAKHSLRVLTRAGFDGINDAAHATLLLVGIGMVLKAVFHPLVKEVMTELLGGIIPTSPIIYILFFAILAPLSLYRGPLNMWGLGSGFLAIIISTGILPAQAAMAAFMSTERVQSSGDPTNSQNAWTAGFAGVDVNELSRKTVPWLWIMSAISAIVAGILYL